MKNRNNSWTHPAFFSRHLVPQNVGNIIFVCYFLNIGFGPTKSQCSRHFSKQSIPGLFYLKPHRKVSATELELRTTNFENLKNRPNCFQTLTFCRNLGFQKPGVCPRQPPRGVYISRNDTKNIYFSGKWQKHQQSLFFDKMAFLFMFFLCIFQLGHFVSKPTC